MKALKYAVEDFTSQDELFPANNLSIFPLEKGWNSAPFADFPQSLTFFFEGEVEVKKLQILSHEYKISTKVDIYVGFLNDQSDISSKNCTFRKIGFFGFKSNEATNYLGNELRSFSFEFACNCVKLVFLNNHINPKNYFNQGLNSLRIVNHFLNFFLT